jgi:hypothetical protein
MGENVHRTEMGIQKRYGNRPEQRQREISGTIRNLRNLRNKISILSTAHPQADGHARLQYIQCHTAHLGDLVNASVLWTAPEVAAYT